MANDYSVHRAPQPKAIEDPNDPMVQVKQQLRRDTAAKVLESRRMDQAMATEGLRSGRRLGGLTVYNPDGTTRQVGATVDEAKKNEADIREELGDNTGTDLDANAIRAGGLAQKHAAAQESIRRDREVFDATLAGKKAETGKVVAESGKIGAETGKVGAEAGDINQRVEAERKANANRETVRTDIIKRLQSAKTPEEHQDLNAELAMTSNDPKAIEQGVAYFASHGKLGEMQEKLAAAGAINDVMKARIDAALEASKASAAQSEAATTAADKKANQYEDMVKALNSQLEEARQQIKDLHARIPTQ